MRYWINTVSLAHVRSGVEGGFMQADHGDDKRLNRLGKGDRVVFYSPRAEMRSGPTVQRFTAIGEIADEAAYQTELTADSRPWRRRVAYAESTEAPVRALIDDLEFITKKERWGFPFRRGLFEIG